MTVEKFVMLLVSSYNIFSLHPKTDINAHEGAFQMLYTNVNTLQRVYEVSS